MSNKLREALEELCAVDFGKLMFPLDGDSSAIYNSDKKEIPTYWWVAEILNQVKRAQDTAKAALAEPLKNCDVGTAEEQSKRFKKYCALNKDFEWGCEKCPIFPYKIIKCEFIWSQMPYESEVKE